MLEENPFKFEAAQNWCKERDVDFVVITEDEISLLQRKEG